MTVDNVISGTTLLAGEYTSQLTKVNVENVPNEKIQQPEKLLKNRDETGFEFDIEQKISSLNGFLQPIRTNLKFELHEKLDRYYVSVIDSNTHEVIKEIPPKKLSICTQRWLISWDS